MRMRILICVMVASCLGFGVYLFTWQGGRDRVTEAAGKTASGESPGAEVNWDREIREALGGQSLFSLRDRLRSLPGSEAVTEIEEFLRTGQDRNTGLILGH